MSRKAPGESTEDDAIADNSRQPPVVVGIGASGASPDSIERFFSTFVRLADQATVLVVQHREALSEERLRETLGKVDGLTISDVEDGALIEGGLFYICTADLITTIHDGRFKTRLAEESLGKRGTIDSFLVSLAEDRAEEAVGVVLDGTGGDGTLGVRSLKEHGGLTIAERDTLGRPVRMPNGHTAGTIADFVLPAEDIPEHVATYVRHLRRQEVRRDASAAVSASAEALKRIADILRARTGNDFHGYKQNTFMRRVQRRMQVIQINDIEKYTTFLHENVDEVHNLFNDLLIGVTQFFRDPREFDVLAEQVIPTMFDGKGQDQQLRVWILGCATGEEAYSIGILLREHMGKLPNPPQVQIFATDLDGRALATARVGRYRKNIEQDVSPERLERWFVKEGDTYCVAKELREMCIFSQHNVIKDAPFSRLDLVSCRNLLIYLNSELQNRVIPLFHFALLPDRFLFLGNSENVTRYPKLFVPIDRRARIFKRLENGVRLPPEFPIGSTGPRSRVGRPANRAPSSDIGLERRAQRVAERYAPAYVIVDEQLQVVHFSGRSGRFIEPSSGAASLDLLQLIHRDVRLELRSALHRAMEENKAVSADGIQVGVNGSRVMIDLAVEPLQDNTECGRHFVVIFKEGAPTQLPADLKKDDGLVRSEHVERLEGELRTTRERLQATIEELESTNEELKSSNEEYQSLNEELQSANEELETSREELQSVNEELTTVNGELGHRVQDLTKATSDLKNLLEATQIATVFLDNDLNIMNFTPAVTQVLHLVETDIGRPISHIKARLPIEELYDDIRHVLRTLSTIERELGDPDVGTRYIIRILPYRSVENYIAGAVITFMDVTAIMRAEERQRLLLSELQHRVRNTLAVVRSLSRRSAQSSSTVDEFAQHLDGRLNAFARTQALVTRDPGAGVDLEFLVAEELLAFRVTEESKVSIAGPALRLTAKAAETFGLAVHELATNAVKYGALSKPTGRVAVMWQVERTGDAAILNFVWKEEKGPALKGRPARRGFGTELLERTLAFDLRAKTSLDFETDGLICTIDIPLNERVLMKGFPAK